MGMALAASALLLTATAVAAQQQSREPTPPQETATQQECMAGSASTTDRVYRASQLIGATVSNTQGEKLGQIEDVVIDPADANVAYAVLSFGGFLGLGEKYFAIPWNALTVNTDSEGELDYLEAGQLDPMRREATQCPDIDANRELPIRPSLRAVGSLRSSP